MKSKYKPMPPLLSGLDVAEEHNVNAFLPLHRIIILLVDGISILRCKYYFFNFYCKMELAVMLMKLNICYRAFYE